MIRIDARLPLRFGPPDSRGPNEALLWDQGLPGPAPSACFTPTDRHQVDCACCAGRSGAALALAALFRARVVGQGAPFRSVLAVVGPAGEAEVREALVSDPLASGRFKLVETPPSDAS